MSDGMLVFGVVMAIAGLLVDLLLLALAFRFVGAHERLAHAMKRQSDALAAWLRREARKGPVEGAGEKAAAE